MQLPTTRSDGSPILAGDTFVFNGVIWVQINPYSTPFYVAPPKPTLWRRFKSWVISFFEKKNKPNGCAEFCGMNYCDENGCNNRKREPVEPIPPQDREYIGNKQVRPKPPTEADRIRKNWLGWYRNL